MLSLGMEFSTQSVKIVMLDVNNGDVIYASKLDYDERFPEYKTVGGVLDSSAPEVRHTSPFMLIESLDYVFKKLVEDGIDLSAVCAVKVDGMQHCTIYANDLFENIIGRLDSGKNLVEQIGPSISRKTVPIWEDRSPVAEVEILSAFFEEKGGIENLTGNKAELRFPAAQIMKWAKEFSEEYKETAHIFVLSTFITSVLSGKVAPVDTGDGWGTNLNNLDIKTPRWSKEILVAIDSYLRELGLEGPLVEKIGDITHYDSSVGEINDYFIKRYGINSKAIVLAGTGDNPATLLGGGGRIVISLGSSYTVNGVMEEIIPSNSGEYNVFGYTEGRAMALSCITNGGKVHEFFMRKYVTEDSKETGWRDWKEYIKIAGDEVLSEDENLLLPYLMDESVPLCKKGIVRENFDESDGTTNIRALHISQALSLRIHSSHLNEVDNLCIVGGGSRNRFLRQVISDVFDAKSYTIKSSDYAAPLGCAISGAKAILDITYEEACDRFVQKDESSCLRPKVGNSDKVKVLIQRYKDLEGRRLICMN